jgi:hypothetical protein
MKNWRHRFRYAGVAVSMPSETGLFWSTIGDPGVSAGSSVLLTPEGEVINDAWITGLFKATGASLATSCWLRIWT